MEVQSSGPPVHRQRALHLKLLITWGLIAVALTAHGYAPAQVSLLWPIGILLISRSFLWPAWLEASQVVWRIFLGCQIAAVVTMLLPVFPSGLEVLIWNIAGSCYWFMVAFLFSSDVEILRRSLAIRRAKATAGS